MRSEMRRAKRPQPTRLAPVLLAASLLAAAAPAVAWNGLGHQVVARIAWEQMSPGVRAAAVALLSDAPRDADLAQLRPGGERSAETADRILFQTAAMWADMVRDRDFPERNEKYHRSNWHYINYFWDNEGPNGSVRDHPTLRPQDTNAVERHEELAAKALDPSRDRAQRAIDLAWVLHLTGDLHQPLHTSGRVTASEPEGDRGGNDFRLAGNGNLHSYWDGTLSRDWTHWFWLSEDAHVGRIARAIARRHPPSPLGPEVSDLDPEAWARSGHELARTIAYPSDLRRGSKPSRAYRQVVHDEALERLALAGYRLAEILGALADEETR